MGACLKVTPHVAPALALHGKPFGTLRSGLLGPAVRFNVLSAQRERD